MYVCMFPCVALDTRRRIFARFHAQTELPKGVGQGPFNFERIVITAALVLRLNTSATNSPAGWVVYQGVCVSLAVPAPMGGAASLGTDGLMQPLLWLPLANGHTLNMFVSMMGCVREMVRELMTCCRHGYRSHHSIRMNNRVEYVQRYRHRRCPLNTMLDTCSSSTTSPPPSHRTSRSCLGQF